MRRFSTVLACILAVATACSDDAGGIEVGRTDARPVEVFFPDVGLPDVGGGDVSPADEGLAPEDLGRDIGEEPVVEQDPIEDTSIVEDVAEEVIAGDTSADIEVTDTTDTGPEICIEDEIPVRCGGRAGNTCRANQYCEFPDDLCGAADGQGDCRCRPVVCERILAPVCGCDGEAHQNQCEGQKAGADLRITGGCEPPGAEWSGCGSGFCISSVAYCVVDMPDEIGVMPPTCTTLPELCAEAPSCDCLVRAEVQCAYESCVEGDDGGIKVTCLGG